MKVELIGYVANVSMKVGPSQDLVKEVKLEVHGNLSTLQDLMKQPLRVSFEPIQAKFGEEVPQRKGGKKPKSKKEDA